MYRPLRRGLFIEESSIDGQGLYTNVKLTKGTNLGMSHLELGKLILRTPMGGFINHSDKPNCIKVKAVTRQRVNPLYDHNFTKWDLVTIKDIEVGEELTIKYTFYSIEKDFLEESQKEKKELEESYKESVRQTKERT